MSNLFSLIFVKNPGERITIKGIKKHPWYQHRLPVELMEGYQGFPRCGGKGRWHARFAVPLHSHPLHLSPLTPALLISHPLHPSLTFTPS